MGLGGRNAKVRVIPPHRTTASLRRKFDVEDDTAVAELGRLHEGHGTGTQRDIDGRKKPAISMPEA